MPKVIVKCRYYSPQNTGRDIGGLLRYIATREGVERFGQGWKTAPASKEQLKLIQHLITTVEKSRRLPEHKSFRQAQTKGAASEFISAALENFPELLSEKTYLDYIATRPRVERVEGSHGLFTDKDIPISLSGEAEALRNHNGNVFTVIVSLKREDAERLGFNSAERWQNLVRSKIPVIAKEHNIPLDTLKWFGAFHNESHHPHIHLMLYSQSQDTPGHIDKKGIDHLRHMFGTSIFQDELKQIYDDQTAVRNKLNADAADEVEALAEKIRTGLAKSDEFVLKFVALANHLQAVSGKKVYGYLPAKLKREVCSLVDFLEEDEDIARLYELWYQAKCAVYNTYTDNNPIKKPLSQEEAFKPIRNAIIREADALGNELAELDHSQAQDSQPGDTMPADSKQSSSQGSQSQSSASSSSQSASHTTGGSAKHTESGNARIATSVVRLCNGISKTFRDNYYDRAMRVPSFVESRLQREIEAKKKGQNLSM